jgi:hypothetical protein
MKIEKGALDYIAKIDEMGGALQSNNTRTRCTTR